MEKGDIKHRLEEKHITNDNYNITIIEYFGCNNCTVKFDDGTILTKLQYGNIKSGCVKKPKQHRVGEVYKTNQGYNIEIIKYNSATDITVRFEDGVTLDNTSYYRIKEGSIKRPNSSKIGEKFLTRQGCEIEVVQYFNSSNCTIKFDNGVLMKNVQYGHIKRGVIKSPFYPSINGVGYIGSGKFLYNKNTKCRGIWKSMLQRCYNKNFQEKQPTYKGCSVATEWHNFQNFAEWFEENYEPHMEGFHFDKDILVKGNKIYSPETCCFIPFEINLLFTANNINRGKYPIGVSFFKDLKKFISACSINGTQKSLGYFDTPEEAFQAYKTAKEKHIKEVADKWKEQITEQTYQALYNYQVEITD